MDNIKQMPLPQQKPEITHDMVRNAKTVQCSCGSKVFENVVVLKSISAILSPTGEQMDIPINAFACKACGLLNPDTDPFNVLPPEIKSNKVNTPGVVTEEK